MSKIAARVDPTLLGRLMAWAADIPDFEVHHAADGLYIAEGCRTEDLPEDPEAVFLVALVMAFWFWLDDRSDKSLRDPQSPVDWEALFAFADAAARGRGGHTPEERCVQRVSAALSARARRPDEHRWWILQTVRVLRAMHTEDLVARHGQSPTFVECLENGGDSTTLMSFMSSAYLAYGLDRPARQWDPRLANVERYMTLSQRLLNDLHSVDVERNEGHAGRPSNLVLVMESFLPRAEARAFVEAQQRAYERMMLHNIELLGPEDPFGGMTLATIRRIHGWYAAGPLRYEEGSE